MTRKIMLMKDYDKLSNAAKASLFDGKTVAQHKYDGVAAYAVCNPDADVETVAIFSSTGIPVHSLEHIRLALFKAHVTGVIFFEVYQDGVDQSEISGRFRRRSQYPEARAIMFDYVSLKGWAAGEWSIWYKGRLEILAECCPIDPACEIVYSHPVASLEQANEIATDVIDRGGEGIVVKSMQGSWFSGKRSTTQAKLKQRLDFDLEVVGIKEGKGKFAGKVGALVIQWKNGVTFTVSGMKSSQRTAWWDNPELIVGKIVEIHAMTYSSNGSLREPRFKSIRYSKTVSDIEEGII